MHFGCGVADCHQDSPGFNICSIIDAAVHSRKAPESRDLTTSSAFADPAGAAWSYEGLFFFQRLVWAIRHRAVPLPVPSMSLNR